MIRNLFALVLFSSIFAMAGEGPQLEVSDNADYNLGVFEQGEEVKATISFTNNGDTALTIDKVKTPCGCTKAALEKTTFAPGESGSFDITINTTRLTGDYDKKITILSNDSNEPEQKVRVHFKMATQANASLK